MFIIGISLRFIDIINESWHQLQTSDWSLNPLSKKYQQWQITHYFDALVLLISIASETSVLS